MKTKTEYIGLTMEPELKAKCSEAARQLDIPVSQWIRAVLKAELVKWDRRQAARNGDGADG